MSSRAIIGYENPDGKIQSIYVHYDGYPEGAGEILKDKFNTETKAKKLTADSDLRSLHCMEQYESKSEILDGQEFLDWSHTAYLYLWKNNKWNFFDRNQFISL